MEFSFYSVQAWTPLLCARKYNTQETCIQVDLYRYLVKILERVSPLLSVVECESTCRSQQWDSVADVSLEDSGNYTCEVRGHGSIVKARVTHYVFVRGQSVPRSTFVPYAHGTGRESSNCLPST